MIWYVIIVLTIAAFIVLHGFVAPRQFLRRQYSAQVYDRGIRNINEVGGHSILYAPAVPYRKYLKHYAVSKRNGKMQLICDFDKKIDYAEFQISLFNGEGNVFSVLHVKQAVTAGETEAIDLPEETAYVSVALNNVDGKIFKGDRRDGVSKESLKKFLIISSAMELVVMFILKICLAKMFGGIFAESFIEEPLSNLMTVVFAAMIVLLNNILTMMVVKGKQGKQVKRDKNARI